MKVYKTDNGYIVKDSMNYLYTLPDFKNWEYDDLYTSPIKGLKPLSKKDTPNDILDLIESKKKDFYKLGLTKKETKFLQYSQAKDKAKSILTLIHQSKDHKCYQSTNGYILNQIFDDSINNDAYYDLDLIKDKSEWSKGYKYPNTSRIIRKTSNDLKITLNVGMLKDAIKNGEKEFKRDYEDLKKKNEFIRFDFSENKLHFKHKATYECLITGRYKDFSHDLDYSIDHDYSVRSYSVTLNPHYLKNTLLPYNKKDMIDLYFMPEMEVAPLIIKSQCKKYLTMLMPIKL